MYNVTVSAMSIPYGWPISNVITFHLLTITDVSLTHNTHAGSTSDVKSLIIWNLAGIQLMVNAFNNPSSMIHNSNMAALQTCEGKLTSSVFTEQGSCFIYELSFVTSCHASVARVVGRLNEVR
jgi:hypothetical protein